MPLHTLYPKTIFVCEVTARLGQRERGYAPDKWSSGQMDWRTDGWTNRLITIGRPQIGALMKYFIDNTVSEYMTICIEHNCIYQYENRQSLHHSKKIISGGSYSWTYWVFYANLPRPAFTYTCTWKYVITRLQRTNIILLQQNCAN